MTPTGLNVYSQKIRHDLRPHLGSHYERTTYMRPTTGSVLTFKGFAIDMWPLRGQLARLMFTLSVSQFFFNFLTARSKLIKDNFDFLIFIFDFLILKVFALPRHAAERLWGGRTVYQWKSPYYRSNALPGHLSIPNLLSPFSFRIFRGRHAKIIFETRRKIGHCVKPYHRTDLCNGMRSLH